MSFRASISDLFGKFPISAFSIQGLIAASLLFAIPQVALAVEYSVCKLPAICDYESPEMAVNDPIIGDGDTINIVTDTYVLGATLQVDASITILANDSVFDANGIRAIAIPDPVTLTLMDVTIRNGQAPAGSGGGALLAAGGSVATIINAIFENNQADFGGAIHNIGATVSLIGSTFNGNLATAGEGGAILTVSGGISNIDSTTIDGNRASLAGGGLAVTDPGSTLNLINTTVSNNVALDPTPTVSNPVISSTTVSCFAPGATGQTFVADALVLSAFDLEIQLKGPGGDLSVIPSDLNIAGLVRQGGLAGPVIATAVAFAPGGVWPGTSTQTLSYKLDQPVALIPGDTYALETTIEGAYSIFISSLEVDEYADGGQFCNGVFTPNWDFTFATFGGTPGEGSGIYASGAGFVGLFNSTVSSNAGDGVVATSGGMADLEFSTIANNSLNGLMAEATPPVGQIALSASIIANNGGFDCSGSDFTSFGHNLIGDNSGCVITPSTGDLIGTAEVPIDPLLGPLQDNGGRTSTHAIVAASPALDSAGLGGALPCTDASADQRGVTRPNGPACDMGAFEFAPSDSPLQALIDIAAAGSVIDVPDGIYTESIIIGDGKILRGSGPGSAVIDVTGLGESAITASGDFTLEGVRVTGGNSPDNGGGIVANIDGTDITLINVVLDGNAASSDGGALYLADGTLTAINSTFTNNIAGGNGGAILGGPASSMSISAVLFDSNSATGNGGAIANEGSVTITDTTLSMNDASVGGGIFNESGAALSVSKSTLSNNTANIASPVVAGGAIAGAGIMDIGNSTLSGNSATVGHGGGIALTAGTAKLNGVTLAFNAAPLGERGALFAEPGALISLSNSLLSGNSDAGAPGPGCDTVNSLGYNLSFAADCLDAPTDITAPAMIGVLTANGGATETHSLDALSPARNAGHPVPNFTGFDSGKLALLQTQGFTTSDAGSLLLAAGTFNVGSAFVSEPIDPNMSFSARFQFLIVPGASGAADGFTFTIADDPTVLGAAGGFLGIGIPDPIEPSPAVRGVVSGVSVEFDTWDNGLAEGANDPVGADHIGIDINGSLSSESLAILGLHGILSDGSVWTAWVDYDASTKTLEARTSNDGIRPVPPTVSAAIDLAALTGPIAYVGFTAATGSAGISGEQRILNFSFANSCELTDQRGDPRPKGAACDIGAFEAAAIPSTLGPVTLSTVTIDQEELDDGTSYPGVVDVPIIDIPIEKLTGETFNTPESTPLGSFPLGSFPLGSFPLGSFNLQTSPLGSFPLGSFPLGSFPLGSFPLGSFPLGSFPLSSLPLLIAGGWAEILAATELAGAPLQTVTLEDVLKLSDLPDSITSLELRDLAIQGSPLASLSSTGISLGNTSVRELDDWAKSAAVSDPVQTICKTLTAADPSFTDCTDEDTLLGLEMQGAPVSALTLASFPLGSFQVGDLPLGSFPLGSFPLGSFPLGSFPLGSFPLGSFPLGSFPLGSFGVGSAPLGSFPLGSFPLGSFPLGSFNLLVAPLGSFPLGSFPLGSFPLGSFEFGGKSFCQLYDELASENGTSSCKVLGLEPDTDSLADLMELLQIEAKKNGDTTSGLSSTPLGSFPLGSFDISNLPLGSFSLETLSEPPISELTLGSFDGCALIADNSDDTCSSLGLDENSSLTDLANAYGGSLAASPLGSFPITSLGVADLPMGSFPLGSFEINGTPLGSFPLGSFDLIGSPLGSFPLGSFSSLETIIDTGWCGEECLNLTLSDAALADAILPGAVLSDLNLSSEFATTTLGEVLNAMTLAMLYGPGILADIENAGNLNLGQLLIAMMLKTDFPWETIPLEQLDAQEYSADNFVAYLVDFELIGSETETVEVKVTLDDGFLYVKGSTTLVVEPPPEAPPATMGDPAITHNDDGTQTLSFNTTLGGLGFSDNTIRFNAVSAQTLGDYPASASLKLGSSSPVDANAIDAMVSIVPHPRTDVSDLESLTETSPKDVLLLGYIDSGDDKDFYRVAPVGAGDRVAVFMANPAGDNDLIMYAPVSAIEAKGQSAEAPPLDSVPFEDDGVLYEGNFTEEGNALEDVNLEARQLASISTNPGDANEAVSAIAGNDDPFTIQVSGYNGATSDQPYTLRVKVTPEVPTPQCKARGWIFDADSSVSPAGEWTPDTNAVFLVNGSRLAASEGDGPAADAALSAINRLISAPGVTDGVVVDVSTIFGVNYEIWDMNPCDVGAANTIVNAITTYLEEQRKDSPQLSYVTIVGSDEIIPFARKPDETSIANESTFANAFFNNAMYGALITRHILSDDTYGDIDPIPWFGRFLNVPELGVGRLVESAEDIQTAADNYIDSDGVLYPQTALSVGYDFIADAAEKIDDIFARYSDAFGFDVKSALIDQPGVDPTAAWSLEDFLDETIRVRPNPVEQVSFNMHFNFSEALPSSGDAAGNYTDNLFTTTHLGSTDLSGGIWFTVGCHSGSNLADVSVVDGEPGDGDDWAQSFSHLGAVYLAQNGYGLGDTEAIALSERLLVLFARNLNGTMTVGQAHAFAKQQYLGDLGLYGEYDYKSLQTATLFGLPMYRYGNGDKIEDESSGPLEFEIDPISGLVSAKWPLRGPDDTLPDTGISSRETSKGTLFSVDGEVQFIHFRPLQPIVRRDVTHPDGEIAAGAFLTALVTQDIAVDDIAFARPVIAVGKIEPEIETDVVVFPTSFTNISSFKAPPLLPDTGPFEPRQQLNVIVGQFTSPEDGLNHGVERLFRSFETQIFYRSSPDATDFIRPELDNIQAKVVGPSGAKLASFSVDVFDENPVLRVAILYLRSVSGSPALGTWELLDLVHGSGNNWTGAAPVDISIEPDRLVSYMVQAVNSNGIVANSTFKGRFYDGDIVEPPPTTPGPGTPPGQIGVVVSSDGIEVDPANWITSEPVDIEVTNKNPDLGYEYSVDSSAFVPLTSSGFQVSGDLVHIVSVQESGGNNPVTFAIMIDTTPPLVLITTPAEGEFIVQGQASTADFDCFDATSGIATCTGTVANGAPVPSATTGTQSFVVSAQDFAHQNDDPPTPVIDENGYYVVQTLEVDGPADPTLIGDPVVIAASATDLADIVETASIDWGDGSPVEMLDLDSMSLGDMSASHSYSTPDVYQITVSIDYEGRYTQTGALDFVVIYAPNGGFTTGSGWINSPPSALTPNDSSDPHITGKAHFSFKPKYRKGKSVPIGSADFRFMDANLKFDARDYDWMIISGARARFQGEGVVKGSAGLYKFRVTVLDSDVAGSGISADGFRIKIWQETASGTEFVLYDNGLGVDESSGDGGTTPLGGGSITVHSNRK